MLEKPFNSVLDLVDPALLKSLPLLRPHQSVDADLARYFADPRVRLAFSFQTKYLGMSPFRCPSLFTILSFLEYEYGVFHPLGGCGAVMAAMAQAATEMGVRIRLNEPVEEILFEGRKAVGVRTNARRVQGRRAGGQRRLRPGDDQRWCPTICAGAGPTRRSAARNSPARPSCSTSASRARCPTWRTTRSYLSKDYARNIEDIEDGLELPGGAHRSTCRTPASPTRRWRRPATARSTCWCRCAPDRT